MVPNPGYGGPIKPALKEFFEVPFTQAGEEFNQLKSATSVTNTVVDYGYLPANDALQKNSLDNVYNFEPSDRVAGAVLPCELHQPGERADLQIAVLQTGDAGTGRPEHVHQQGVLRVRVPDVRPGADQAILELRRLVREEQSISV